MIGNKTSLSKIASTLTELLEDASQCHKSALNSYPAESYMSYDMKSVNLRKQYAILSTSSHVKYIELGINVIDEEIFYLQHRILELKNFYFKASDLDKNQIEQSMKEIEDKVWNLEKKKNELMNSDIIIEN